MNLDKKMVFSKSLRNHRKIKRQLNRRSRRSKFVVVAFRGPEYKLEIHPAKQFSQKMFPVEELFIIGAFSDNDEAIEFIRVLTEYSFIKLNKLDFKEAYVSYREENS